MTSRCSKQQMTRLVSVLRLLYCVVALPIFVSGFSQKPPRASTLQGQVSRHSSVIISRLSLSEDEESSNGKGNKNNNNGRWSMEVLRSRQAQLESKNTQQEKKWREADCQSGVQLSLPDWVRRLDVQYPLAACGTASGTIYLANLESGEILAEGDRVQGEPLENIDHTLFSMFGKHDGSGTLAIAFGGDLICEANRDGGVHFWRLDAGSTRLVYQGNMRVLEGTIVTCIHLDDDFLWVADATGKLQAFPLESNMPLGLQTQPEMQWQFRSMIMSMSLKPDIGCGVATTVEGTVELFSLESGGNSLCSFYPPYDDDDEEISSIHGLSAVLVEHREHDGDDVVRYSIAVGGNDGSLYLQPIQIDEDGELDQFRPFGLGSLRRFKPRHKGPVKCLANPIPGMLVSASLDGSMRVWDVETAHCIYQFVGYKVWLGSLWADNSRIVSDGSDNTVIVHDFEKNGFPEDPNDQIDDDFDTGFR